MFASEGGNKNGDPKAAVKVNAVVTARLLFVSPSQPTR